MSENVSLEWSAPNPAEVCSLDPAARSAPQPRRPSVRFCRHGRVAPLGAPDTGGRAFNGEGLRRLCPRTGSRPADHLNPRGLRRAAARPDQPGHPRKKMWFLPSG